MIVMKLIGGLGNQIFQYALGRNLANINNTQLKLDVTGFEEYKLHNYGLGHFYIQENFATQKEIEYFKKYQRKSGRKWFLYNKLVANEQKYIQEKQFNFNPKILETGDNSYIDGYWQNEKYFTNIENIIRNEITLKTPLSEKSARVAEKIDTLNSVSIHIRRGDYVNNINTNKYHGTCKIEYYEEAVKLITNNIKNPNFFVFSDDQEWAKANIKLPYPTFFVDHNNSKTNYEDLLLMSLCKHNIIANSSFSWWSAWLNPKKDKIVIGPKIWFKNAPKVDTSDVLPKSWIKI